MADIFGTQGNDTLTGTPEFDFIAALAGNDSVLGLEGDDQLNGNQGIDTVDGGSGNDLLRGGQDNDQLFGNIGNDILYGDLGNDTGFGGDGDDILYGDQGREANFGGNGNDFLYGQAGNDTLLGGDGDDLIQDLQGANVINGNQGNDFISSGEGNDLIRGGKGNDQIFGGNQGEDTIFGDLGDDSVWGGGSRTLIFGGQGNDSLVGNSGNGYVINGNQGNDIILGAITGIVGGGNGVLRGGQDDDFIIGDGGNEFIYGDKNSAFAGDTVTGGGGNDIFFLGKETGGALLNQADIITDFVNGTDLIGLTESLRFEDLSIFQGTGINAADTIIQNGANGQFLALLRGSDRNTIDRTDFITPGTLAFSAPTFRVNEDGTPVAAVTVTRTEGSDGAVSATVIVSDGTAIAPADYNNTSVVVNFAAGDFTPKTVTIPIIDDSVAEYPETINLSLSNATGNAHIGTQNTAVLEIAANNAQFVPRLTFRSPTPDAGGFGYSIATVGNNVLIGAPARFSSSLPGAAYLFDGNTGTLLQTFLNPTPNSGDGFGNSVAFVGNNVLIGAPFDDTTAENAGAAYLFDGTTGALLQTFLSPNPVANSFGEGLGSSVAAVGNNILIGASGDDTNGTETGVAYLFNGSTGALLQTLRDPTPNTFELFGESVAVQGNNVLIWAIDRTRSNAQGAYLFDPITGTLLRDFFDPTPNQLGFLIGNQSISVVGNNVLVGASGNDAGAQAEAPLQFDGSFVQAGAAFLFDGSSGALLQSFLNPNSGRFVFDGFGNAVTAVGNNVLIGALFDDIGATQNGAAYLFDSATGTLLQTFLNPTPNPDSNFGTSVASIGNSILIGAPGAEGGGAVYLF